MWPLQQEQLMAHWIQGAELMYFRFQILEVLAHRGFVETMLMNIVRQNSNIRLLKYFSTLIIKQYHILLKKFAHFLLVIIQFEYKV